MQIALRYIHIVSAILAVGGTSFMAWCLLPVAKTMADAARDDLMTRTQQRFIKIVWLSIAGLIITGAINWIAMAGTYKDMGAAGNALIGSKTLLAVIMFGIVFAQNMKMISLKPRAYMIIVVHLAAIVILLASILRTLRLDHITNAGG